MDMYVRGHKAGPGLHFLSTVNNNLRISGIG
jgi:hypothetical protein